MSGMRLGVVGCGSIAEVMGWFARFNRKIELAAACDFSAARAQAYAQRFNIPRTFTAFEAMLEQVELDALYLRSRSRARCPKAKKLPVWLRSKA